VSTPKKGRLNPSQLVAGVDQLQKVEEMIRSLPASRVRTALIATLTNEKLRVCPVRA
jgi:hypothetical protein